jgi:porin
MLAPLVRKTLRGCLALLLSLLPLPLASAQSPSGPPVSPVRLNVTVVDSAEDQQPGTNTQQQPKAGETKYPPDLLDGTLSALGDLEEDDSPHTSRFRTALENWFAWKQKLQKEHGFSFSVSWGVLWQNYTNSRIAQPNAVGSKVTINLAYDLFRHNKPNAFSVDMAVEDRRALGTAQPPLQAGIGAGSIVPTAATWGQFDIGITQLYVRQSLFQNHFQYTVGKIFAPNYVDAYPFFDDNRQFLSQQFSTNTTIQSPLRGFGGVAAWFPTESGVYLKGGMFTSNSSDTGSTVADFFSKNQHFYSLEGGLSSLARTATAIQMRGPTDADNIHITGWYRDSTNVSPHSYGFAFNANYKVGESFMWFLRGGWSKTFLANGTATGGFGWRPPKERSDLLGAGFGWTHPSSGALRSQYTAETFYRLQVIQNFAITPDIQLVLHPTLNPRVNTIWVFSLRARVVF